MLQGGAGHDGAVQNDSDPPPPSSPPPSEAVPAHLAGPPAPLLHHSAAGAIPPPPPPPPPPLPWGFGGETTWQPVPQRPPHRRRAIAAALAGLFLVSIGAGFTAARLTDAPTSSTGSSTSQLPASVPGNSSGGGSATSTAPADTGGIAARVTPGIVNINITLSGGGAAAGTGMIITSTGEVLTNNHVIDGETSISVELPSTGQTYGAHVLGYDLTEDVALVQIDGGGSFHTVNIGNSSNVTVGQAVVALGNALGRNAAPAVSTGNVSALNQTITASDQTGADVETVSGLIQIDAPIQPGDSGGPLVTTDGTVIGMDTAAASAGRLTQTSSIAYAIPINKAIQVVKQIQSGHSTSTVHVGSTRALLGVGTSEANGGVQVVQVQGGSPAAAAGISVGSTITALDGTAVSSNNGLRNAIMAHNPGASVSVSWTDAAGTSHTATVTLGSGPPG